VRIGIDVIETIRVKGRSAPDNSVDLVTFGEEELGEIRTILASDAGDERFGRGFG
jgi:hypothetical protein